MKELEGFLRKKLDLLDKDEIRLKRFGRQTRNINYILEVSGEPLYFLKVHSEGIEKEIFLYDFLRENPLFKTPMPLYKNNKIIILPFIPDFRDTEIKENLKFILDFHNKSLNLSKDSFKKCSRNKLFVNNYFLKFSDRVNRHFEMVKNFWEDIESLIKFYHSNPSSKFEELPKILVHGDIQHKNLQMDEKGNIYLIDFEDFYFDHPSWDLSRPLMDLEYSEMEEFREEYIKQINISNKGLLRKAINRDFVIRVITDSIGRQQRFGVKGAKPYLDIYRTRYMKKLEEIVYNGN